MTRLDAVIERAIDDPAYSAARAAAMDAGGAEIVAAMEMALIKAMTDEGDRRRSYPCGSYAR